MESLKRLPSREIILQTKDSDYYFFKADILTKRITYSTDKRILVGEQTISAHRAFDIINMNREGKKPLSLIEDETAAETQGSGDLLDQESINRFDHLKKKKKNRNKRKGDRKDNAQS